MLWGGSPMLSPPPAQEIRPPGSRRGSVQGREQIGVVYWTLDTASLWKLKAGNQVSVVECAASVPWEKKILTVPFTK